jgi:predicted component of type VI protein secretion system
MRLKLQWQVNDEVYEYRINPARSIIIGRHSECDITLFDEHVSREHAAVFTNGGKTCLRNMSESNQITFKSPATLPPLEQDNVLEIQGGYVFQMGRFEIQVLAYDPAAEPTQEVICPNCGQTVEDRGEDCPSCGASLAFARRVK